MAPQQIPCQGPVLPAVSLNLTSWHLESGEWERVRKMGVEASCAMASCVTLGRSHGLALLLLSGK